MVFLAYVIVDGSPAFISVLSGRGVQGLGEGEPRMGAEPNSHLTCLWLSMRSLCVNHCQRGELTAFYCKLHGSQEDKCTYTQA